MNNLNKSTPKKANKEMPDILTNLNIKEDVNEKGYHKESVHKAIEKKKLNVEKEIPSEEQPDFSHLEEERRKSRKMKKAFGIAGWVLCFPLMLVAIAVRDKPSTKDSDEWKDDPCLPWWYDTDFKYPGEDDIDD